MTLVAISIFIITFGLGRIYLHYRYNKRIDAETEHLMKAVHNVK